MSPTLLLLMCFVGIVSRPSKAKQIIDGVIDEQERTLRDSLNFGVNCYGFSPCRKHQAGEESSSLFKGRETHSPLGATARNEGVTSVWVPAGQDEEPVFYGPEDELFYNLRRAMTILQALDGGSWEGVDDADRKKFQEEGVDSESGEKSKEASYDDIIASRRITFEKFLGIFFDPRDNGSDQSENKAFVGRIGNSSLDLFSNKRKNTTISETRANNGSQDVTQSSVNRAVMNSGSNYFKTLNNATSRNSSNSNQSMNNENNSSSSNGVYPSSSQRIRRDLPGLPMSEENIPKPLSMPGLILAHGYPAEVHHVTTEDGYILELHRIPGPRMVDASPKKHRRSGRSARTSSKVSTNPILEDEKFRAFLESLNGNQVLSVENMEGMKEILDRYYKKPDIREHFHRVRRSIQRKPRFKRSDMRQWMARNRQLIRTVDPMLLMQRGRFGRRSQYGNRRYISSPTQNIPVMNPPPPPLLSPPSTQQFLRGPQPSVEANAKRSISRATLGINSAEGGDHLNNFINSPNSQSDEKDREVKEFIKATACLKSSTPCSQKKNFTSNFLREQVANGNYKVFNNDWKESNDIEGNNKPGSLGKKKVVFIQHCLQCSSADFVLNDHNEALGFILADAGYDVWLGNFRGNQYSRRHTTLSPNDVQFWKFKVDDLARYDIPAMILYVLGITKSDDLYYVGHSLGTMTFFMATSTNPFIMSKIRLMIALAPSGYLDHMRGGLKLLLKSIQNYYRLVEAFGLGEIGGVLPWRGPMMRRFCKPESPLVGVCSSLLPALSGRNSGLHDEDYLPLMLANFPSGTSFRLMAQIGQIIGSDGIRMFDFGNLAENMQHYQSDTPPHYPLQKITCPVAIMWAQNDYIVAPEDVLRLARRLPNVVLNYKVPHPTFNHVDFLFADIARGLVYEPMLKLLAQY